MRPAGSAEIAVTLDRDSTVSLPQQLVTAVRELIRDRILQPGDTMPATRSWAAQLGVSRGTVVTAYEQLAAEGYVVAERGAATRVNPSLAATHPDTAPKGSTTQSRRREATSAAVPTPTPTRRPRASAATPHPVTINMLPGQSSSEHLSTPAWRRAWRNAVDGEFEAAPLGGAPEYLSALSDYFRRMRGLARDASQYLATAGGRDGLALIVLTLAAEHPGRPLRVGVESPGYPSLRLALRRLGCTLIPLGVDEQGLRTDSLPRGGAKPDLVIVTPSHQYPLGGSLPIARRLELLKWARQESVLIIEDDYDSELRYVGQPLPTLTALDEPGQDTVVLLGTFTTTVAPGLGIGMLCVPDALRPRCIDARADLGSPVSSVVQRAFAEYLDSGELARRAARMRRAYRQRRTAVLDAFADVDHLTVSPMDGGLHAVLHSQRSEAGMLRACRSAQVLVEPGGEYWNRAEPALAGAAPAASDAAAHAAAHAAEAGTEGPGHEGGSIVIGYAHLTDAELAEGLRRLRAVL